MANEIDATTLVRSARERAGLSQRALAARAGTTQSVVARIELGQASPTIQTLNRLLAATGHGVDLRLVPTSAQITSEARRLFAAERDRGIVSAYLYGSTAQGKRHAESDIDVAVLLDGTRHQTPDERAEIRVRLGSELVAGLGFNDVDLVVLNDLPPGLARRLVLDGRRLVVFDAEADHAFARDVQLRWAEMQPFRRKTARLKREALTR